jgi:hypothetical protein
MRREDCWMTFSEALLQFLDARDSLKEDVLSHYDKDYQQDRLRDACKHMDAWLGTNIVVEG